MPDATDVAAQVLAALDGGRQVERFSGRIAGFDNGFAYAVTAELRRLRTARGEKPIGRKIGFTNRNIWAEYEVFEPIWGDVYDTTFHEMAPGGVIRASHLPEPRIEPEIVLGIGRDLSAGMSLEEVEASVDWVAHGFEIVQSIFPGWRFAASDCIADGGLHGGLFVGPKHALQPGQRSGLAARLAAVELELSCDGTVVDAGTGSNVLDGPVQALMHLAKVLDRDAQNPGLRAGEVITTGTLTRAFPVVAGQAWSTRVTGGLPLAGLTAEIS